MSDEAVGQVPAVFSSKERAALVARALSEAARRARFSTKRRRATPGGSLRAQRGARLLRWLRIGTFVGIVAVPCLAFAVYIFAIASPQYTAEARFTVRGGMPVGITGLGKLGGAPTMLIVQDTQVILNFMKSRAMVEGLDRAVNLQNLYAAKSIDRWSRLKRHQFIEKVTKYWERHISLSVQMPSGIVTFTVRAFTPDDAVRIANAAIDSSEQLVNTMNDKMREDAVALAETERQHSQNNLATARTNLENARNEEGMLSAGEESKALTTLIGTVEKEQVTMQQQYDSSRRYVRADAPQLKNLQSKIDAAQKEIATLRAQMTRSGPSSGDDKPVLSGSMSHLDYANL
jgi:capsular polysaccharide transport system permease protein